MSTRFAVASGAAELVGECAGGGARVVCLHAGVADRRMFGAQLRALAPSHRVVAWDRRGFGESRSPDEPFAQVGDLEAVLDALSIERALLVGASQGARIAIDFALAQPARVLGLALLAPAVGGARAPDGDGLGPCARERLAALDAAERSGDLERVNALEAALWLDGPDSAEGRVGDPARALFLDMNGIALRAAALTRELAPPPAWDRLEALRLPTLVVVGALDFLHVRERAHAVAARIPGAESHELADVAHLPSFEAPERVDALLRPFLERATGG